MFAIPLSSPRRTRYDPITPLNIENTLPKKARGSTCAAMISEMRNPVLPVIRSPVLSVTRVSVLSFPVVSPLLVSALFLFCSVYGSMNIMRDTESIIVPAMRNTADKPYLSPMYSPSAGPDAVAMMCPSPKYPMPSPILFLGMICATSARLTVPLTENAAAWNMRKTTREAIPVDRP